MDCETSGPELMLMIKLHFQPRLSWIAITQTRSTNDLKAGGAFRVTLASRSDTSETVADSNRAHLGGDIALQYSSGIGASYGMEYINDMSRDDTRANDPFFQHMRLS